MGSYLEAVIQVRSRCDPHAILCDPVLFYAILPFGRAFSCGRGAKTLAIHIDELTPYIILGRKERGRREGENSPMEERSRILLSVLKFY